MRTPSRLARAVVAVLLLLLLAPVGLLAAVPAQAAVALTIRPITWDVIGIDSNKPSDDGAGSGPNVFPVGARVCNTGDVPAADLTTDLLFGGDKTVDNPYLSVQGATTVTFGALAAGACVDTYFNVQVRRVVAAYDTRQLYTITARATGTGTVSTPSDRQLYVEHLISQNRNSVLSISGPSTVFVGSTYTYKVTASTATQGYEQLESFLTFPNTIFRLLRARTTYSAPAQARHDLLYADACGWDPRIGPRPPTGTYLSCDDPAIPDQFAGGKAGGSITMEYDVRVTRAGGGTLSSLVYDYSGSSFHYNGDYGTPANALRVTTVDSDLAVTVSHEGTFQRGGSGVYTLTVTNAGSASVTGPLTVTDSLPAGMTYVSGTGTGYSCAASGDPAAGQTVTCTLTGPVAAGGSRPLQLAVTVGEGTPDPAANRAVVSPGESESDLSNNTATDPTAVNSRPLAVNDSATTPRGTAVTLDPRSGDSDPDGDPLTVTGPRGPTPTPHGSVTCTASACTYTPGSTYAGADSFAYTISDGRGGTSSAVVSILVADRPPSFTDAATNTRQDAVAPGGTLARLVATDPDAGDVLAYAVSGGSLPDGVTLARDGTFSGTTTTPGRYTAAITVSDGLGGTDTTTLVVVVGDPASASVGDVVFEDADGDGTRDQGEPGLAGAVVVVLRDGVEVGRATSDSTGAYAVDGLQVGTYTISLAPPDSHVATSAPQTRTLTAGQVVTDVDLGARLANGTVTLTVFADHDADQAQDPGEYGLPDRTATATRRDDGLVRTGTTNHAGNVVLTLPPGEWSFTVLTSSGETVTTTPLPTATVSPGSAASGLLLGVDADRAPVAVDDRASTPGGTAVVVPVLLNDSDPDGDAVTVVPGARSADHGSVTCTTTGCTYTPDAGYEGPDEFTYEVEDPERRTAAAVVRVTVGGNPPAYTDAAQNDAQTVAVGDALQPLLAADPDGSDLVFSLASGSLPDGVELVPATGAFRGTSAVPGTFTAVVRVSSTYGGVTLTDETTLVVVVNAAPSAGAPVAVADRVTTPTDTGAVVHVVDNDTGAAATVTSSSQPSGGAGTVSCTASHCTFDPVSAFAGTTTFTYTITESLTPQQVEDGVVARTSTTTVTVVVNTPPTVTSPASFSVPLGAALPPATATDPDRYPGQTPDRDVISFRARAVGGPGAAVLPAGLVLEDGGSYTGTTTTPGRSTYDVVASDGRGATTRQTVVVVVSAPPAFDDAVGTNTAQTVPTGGGLVGLVATDPDLQRTQDVPGTPNDALGYALVSGALPAGVTLDPQTGALLGSPTTAGTTTAVLSVTDRVGSRDTTTLVVTVSGGGSLGDVVFADLDGDGVQDAGETGFSVPVTVRLTGDASGSTTTTSSGAWSFRDLAPGSYSVSASGLPAGHVATTSPRTFRLTTGQARTDADLGVQRRDASVPVLVFRDDDRDGGQDPAEPGLQGVTVTLSGGAVLATGTTTGSTGGASFTGLSAAEHVVTVTAPAGTVFTTPLAAGGTASRSVTTTDGTAAPLQRFGVRVSDAGPTAVDDSASTSRGRAVVVPVLANDSDPDGSTLQVVGVSSAFVVADGARTTTVAGAVTCTATSCRYAPPAGFSGTVAFDYAVSDGSLTDVGTVTVVVSNAPPVFTAATVNTAQEVASGSPLSAVTATDLDGDAVTYAVLPAAGQALPPGVALATDGSFTGTPTNTTGSVLTYTATLRASSAGPLSDDTVLVVRVLPVGRPPVFTADRTNTRQTVRVGDALVPLSATDPDADPLAYALVGGTLPPGTVLAANGVLEGSPTTSGTWTATVRVRDPGDLAATSTLVIEVAPAPGNAPPVFHGPGTQVVEVGAPVARLTGSDPEGGAVSWSLGSGGALPPGVTALRADGSVAGTPATPGTYRFPVVLRDRQGSTTTVQATVTVPDVAPVARDDRYGVPAGSTTTLAVLANDTDAGGGPLVLVSATTPSSGTLTCTTTGCEYTAAVGAAGTTVVFDYVVRDQGGLEDTGTVTLVVGPVGSRADLPPAFGPEPQNTAQTVAVGAPLRATLATDPEGAPLTWSVDPTSLPPGITGVDPATGAFTGSATTPGSYPVLVTVTDGAGSDTTLLTVTVTNRTPVARPDSTAVLVHEARVVEVLANDGDDDGQPLTVLTWTQPDAGSVSCTSAGRCTFSAAAAPSTQTFGYTVSDGAGGTASTTVTVVVRSVPVPQPVAPPTSLPPSPSPSPVVTPVPSPSPAPSPPVSPSPSPSPSASATLLPAAAAGTPAASASPSGPAPVPTVPAGGNRPPVGVDDRARTRTGTAVRVPVLLNDTDPDGHVLSVLRAGTPGHGTVTCSAAACTYTPAPGFAGNDVFAVTVSDGRGGTSTSTVTVQVLGPDEVEPAPVARDDSGSTTAGTAVRVPVLGNDTDPGVGPLTVVVARPPAHGTATCTPSGCTYTPEPGFLGTDTFTYTVSDALGGTASATVSITVGSGPRARGARPTTVTARRPAPSPDGPAPSGTRGTSGDASGADGGTPEGTRPRARGHLPRTGRDLLSTAGGGALMVVLGTLLLLVARPRKVR